MKRHLLAVGLAIFALSACQPGIHFTDKAGEPTAPYNVVGLDTGATGTITTAKQWQIGRVNITYMAVDGWPATLSVFWP